ncbi:MAG: flotillin-like protein FloA [Clostridia bacterium]|nr:flotillin-like protein FloA [Clostridia bacterium]
MSTGLIVGLSILGVVVLFLLIVLLAVVPLKLWFRALVSGSHVSMKRLIGMKVRKVKVNDIVLSYISAKKAGLKLTIDDLETHYMAGGNVDRVVKALISAHSANIDISLQTAKAIDLAGRDVYEAIRTSVVPKVIETPLISAVAKDGVELMVKAKVTVTSNIHRQISGAGEDTIIARVGEGIVTTVGSADSHKIVLENPDLISATVLSKGLDSGTAYEILSIDIADIDVGVNIGARLEIDKAIAQKKISEAKAEERRSMAVAHEQEMKAKVQEMQAELLKAEADVPKAMAKALQEGKMSVMDYYELQNLQADTSMRKALGKEEDTKKTNKPQ